MYFNSVANSFEKHFIKYNSQMINVFWKVKTP